MDETTTGGSGRELRLDTERRRRRNGRLTQTGS